MYFYIDESGQTGLKLFDAQQPILYYGVISSPHNLNEVARPFVESLRERFQVERLHASELGLGRLLSVTDELETLHKQFDIALDVYKVLKPDYALISFFDQVFDQGLNKAVPWASYWTPLRYILLAKLGFIFDQAVLELAWEARIEKNSQKANKKLQEVCEILLQRVDQLPDARSREIIGDALKWAKKYPEEIHYNIYSKDDKLQISPNLIGFQSVLHGIAIRLGSNGAKAAAIVVDRQSEFNKAQEYIAEFYKKSKHIPWETGPGLPVMDLTHIPDIPIACTPGDEDTGLELVDVYLWLFKQHAEGKKGSNALGSFLEPLLKKGQTSEVSFNALMDRWEPVLLGGPELSADDIKRGQEFVALQEAERKKHLDGI
ncbi:DUF3800 domain-containing protein [Pseudomonas fluorescens]|uniref:DUF3800 domain-containing protein n=1 Tax=Pseudomonas fluorescens TaxID=294 RepID=UPI00190836C9|nr:DUF3800 domain-containing protein [Pseudomonas fluorescens]MBD8091964.1 DUF3800 domain-containing protein [Pseudomonas fluorescens]MBD8718279.1 DUF3800 domain-containing protein [Pseudomonas fluorescens]